MCISIYQSHIHVHVPPPVLIKKQEWKYLLNRSYLLVVLAKQESTSIFTQSSVELKFIILLVLDFKRRCKYRKIFAINYSAKKINRTRLPKKKGRNLWKSPTQVCNSNIANAAQLVCTTSAAESIQHFTRRGFVTAILFPASSKA